MNGQPESLAMVRGWVEKAENDLRNAECVLKYADRCPTDTVCFHCQQCAEKYLKALLFYLDINFPRAHDLVVLLNMLESKGGIGLRIEEVQPLNRYSVEARYPGEWEKIGHGEAVKALEMAKNVRKAVRAVLPEIFLTME
jgi:HEPN domain-containing protein